MLMRGAVSHLLVGVAKHLLSVILLIIIMFHTEPTLAAIVFTVFPVAIYPVQKLGKRLRKVVDNTQKEFANYTSRLDEGFSAIRIIKSFLAEKKQINKAKAFNDNMNI